MVTVLCVLWFCSCWIGPSQEIIPTERYPDGWPQRQYATLLHRAIVDDLDMFVPNGLAISHGNVGAALGILFHGSNGSTAEEVREAMNQPEIEQLGIQSPTAGSHFKELRYIGVFVPPELNLSSGYVQKIRNMGGDLVSTQPIRTMRRLARKLWQLSPSLSTLIDRNDLPFDVKIQPEIFIVTGAAFSAEWDNAGFHRENRRLREFNVDKRRRTYVDTMYSLARRRQVARLSNLRSTMLLLPLANSSVKFMVILPWKLEGLRQLEQELEFVDLRRLLQSDMEKVEYDVRLPIIDLTTHIQLARGMDYLGVQRAFQRDEADFSRVTGQADGLWVRSMAHYTKLKLNENGINLKHHGQPLADWNREISRHDAGRTANHFFASHPFFFALLDERKIYATGRYGQIMVQPDDV
ncbi:serine protease inhibitor A3L-like [Drosophila guanche]|nr:serine protease inhibitor A3L-like [Drosophila guanche]